MRHEPMNFTRERHGTSAQGTQVMTTWLVCRECGTKEWLQGHTPIVGCIECDAPRHAINQDGEPMVLWSAISDPDDWSPRLPIGVA